MGINSRSEREDANLDGRSALIVMHILTELVDGLKENLDGFWHEQLVNMRNFLVLYDRRHVLGCMVHAFRHVRDSTVTSSAEHKIRLGIDYIH